MVYAYDLWYLVRVHGVWFIDYGFMIYCLMVYGFRVMACGSLVSHPSFFECFSVRRWEEEGMSVIGSEGKSLWGVSG